MVFFVNIDYSELEQLGGRQTRAERWRTTPIGAPIDDMSSRRAGVQLLCTPGGQLRVEVLDVVRPVDLKRVPVPDPSVIEFPAHVPPMGEDGAERGERDVGQHRADDVP